MNKRNPTEWLCLKRTVRFGETDAAGVVHFLQLFKWCHEAWEESLEKYGIVLKEIFPTNQINMDQPNVALPVVHCDAEYFKPLFVGDSIDIELYPKKLSNSSFILRFKFLKNGDQIGLGNIKHVSINPMTRKKCLLSKQINLWIKESSSNF